MHRRFTPLLIAMALLLNGAEASLAHGVDHITIASCGETGAALHPFDITTGAVPGVQGRSIVVPSPVFDATLADVTARQAPGDFCATLEGDRPPAIHPLTRDALSLILRPIRSALIEGGADVPPFLEAIADPAP